MANTLGDGLVFAGNIAISCVGIVAWYAGISSIVTLTSRNHTESQAGDGKAGVNSYHSCCSTGFERRMIPTQITGSTHIIVVAQPTSRFSISSPIRKSTPIIVVAHT